MGAKGVFWYMAIQGRWHYGVTLTLCLISAGLFYALTMGLIHAAPPSGLEDVSLLALIPPALLTFFIHYVLWRRTSGMQNKYVMYLTRLYIAPILMLVALFVLLALLQPIKYLPSMFAGMFASMFASVWG